MKAETLQYFSKYKKDRKKTTSCLKKLDASKKLSIINKLISLFKILFFFKQTMKTSHIISISNIQKGKRISAPYITKFERIKLIATRAMQISKNAPVFTSLTTDDKIILTNSIEIAEKEYMEGVLPLGVRRVLPNGQTEDFYLRDFKNVSLCEINN